MNIASVNGRDFLILVDQYSRWPDVIPFKDKNTSARRIVDASREFFVHGPGAPVRVWSDNGPQFNAMEFKNFEKDWNFSTGTSSPHYPQSNGLAEAAVKSMKNSSLDLGQQGLSTLISSLNHYCYSGTHLVQALSPWHRWCSTALLETRYPLILTYSLQNGNERLMSWKKGRDLPKKFRLSITIKQLINFLLSL
jgi:transposase InsO family protein